MCVYYKAKLEKLKGLMKNDIKVKGFSFANRLNMIKGQKERVNRREINNNGSGKEVLHLTVKVMI